MSSYKIQSFRSITIIQHHLDLQDLLLNSSSLLVILRLPFCCLENFFLDSWNPRSWNSFSSELKDALSNIIHSSTLRTLYLGNIVNVPVTLFLRIAHLTRLELDSLVPNDFNREQSSSLTPAASKGVATASHSVIDQCIWYFQEELEGPNEPIFLPFLCRPRYFEISIRSAWGLNEFDILSLLMRSLSISLTSPATLEHIKFKIWCLNRFDYHRFYERMRDTDVWSHLDSILAHPTGAQLQRVDIDIDYTLYPYLDVFEPDEDEILEAVLDFSPLLRKKGILIVKVDMGKERAIILKTINSLNSPT